MEEKLYIYIQNYGFKFQYLIYPKKSNKKYKELKQLQRKCIYKIYKIIEVKGKDVEKKINVKFLCKYVSSLSNEKIHIMSNTYDYILQDVLIFKNFKTHI